MVINAGQVHKRPWKGGTGGLIESEYGATWRNQASAAQTRRNGVSKEQGLGRIGSEEPVFALGASAWSGPHGAGLSDSAQRHLWRRMVNQEHLTREARQGQHFTHMLKN